MGWFRRLGNTVFDSRVEADFRAEVRAFFDELVRENVRNGATRERAERDARREMGNLALAHDETRDADTLRWLDDLGRDVRHALRQLRRNRAHAAIVVVVLALGIGATTLIFSVINVVLLMRFPYNDANRLVLVQTVNPMGTPGGVAPATFLDWRRKAGSFAYLSAKIDWSSYDVTGPEGPQQVIGVPVMSGIFEVLGVTPQLGRTFEPVDDRPESERVAILSDQLWTVRYKR